MGHTNGVHDKYLDDLCKRLQHNYVKIKKNHDCNLPTRIVTEIDIMAFINHVDLDIYEVKSRYTDKQYMKAKWQVSTASDFLRNKEGLYVRNKYVYFGKEDLVYRI